jgi:hypothetical protein
MFKALDDIVDLLEALLAEAKKQTAILEGKPPVGDPWKPVDPPYQNHLVPTPSVPSIPNTQSLVFTEPYRRHEIKVVSGELVRLKLDAPGRWGATFTMVTTSKDEHVYGPNPRMDRWVDDDSGKVYIREEGMGLNAGSMRAEGPFTRPVYLNIYPKDFTGLVFVEYQ